MTAETRKFVVEEETGVGGRGEAAGFRLTLEIRGCGLAYQMTAQGPWPVAMCDECPFADDAGFTCGKTGEDVIRCLRQYAACVLRAVVKELDAA